MIRATTFLLANKMIPKDSFRLFEISRPQQAAIRSLNLNKTNKKNLSEKNKLTHRVRTSGSDFDLLLISFLVGSIFFKFLNYAKSIDYNIDDIAESFPS